MNFDFLLERPVIRRIMVFVLLAAMALLVYSPTLNTPVFWGNDQVRILENKPYYDQGLGPTFEHAFTPGLGEKQTADRPLTIVSFWLNYKVSGMSPFGFRVVNVLWHAATAFVLCLLLAALMRADGGIGLSALISAVIFLLHPVHFVAIFTLSQRGVLLAGFFGLAAVLAFVYFDRSRRWPWLIAVYTGLCCSVLSKPNGSAFVLVLIMYSLVFGRERRGHLLRALIPAVLLPLAVLAGHVMNQVHPQQWAFGWGKYAADQTVAVLYYLRIFILPFGLHFAHGHDPFPQLPVLIVLAALAFHAGVLGLAARGMFRWPLVAFMVFAVYAALVPESSVFPLSYAVQEYRTYLPYLFLAPVLVLGIERCSSGRATRTVLCIFCIMLGALTFHRNMSQNTEARWLADTARNDMAGAPGEYYPVIHSLVLLHEKEKVLATAHLLRLRAPGNGTAEKLDIFLQKAYAPGPDFKVLLELAQGMVGETPPGLELTSLMDVLLSVAAQQFPREQNDWFKHCLVLAHSAFWMEEPFREYLGEYPQTLRRLRTRYEALPARNDEEEQAYQSVLFMMGFWRLSPEMPLADRIRYLQAQDPAWSVLIKK